CNVAENGPAADAVAGRRCAHVDRDGIRRGVRRSDRAAVAEQRVFVLPEELLVDLIEAGEASDGPGEVETVQLTADRGFQDEIVVRLQRDVPRLRPDSAVDNHADVA